jgi:hypothetical protein
MVITISAKKIKNGSSQAVTVIPTGEFPKQWQYNPISQLNVALQHCGTRPLGQRIFWRDLQQRQQHWPLLAFALPRRCPIRVGGRSRVTPHSGGVNARDCVRTH